MLTMNKEKEIMGFAKSKVKALRILLESQEVQEKYPDLIGEKAEVEWDKFRISIDNFTLNHYETQAELLTIPLKRCVRNLNQFKLGIAEICMENKLGLYVIDAFHTEECDEKLEVTEVTNEDYFLRLCSPSLNRNLQTLRLMTYIEEEKINALMGKVNHVKDKSLQKNIGDIRQLLQLGVEIMVNLSYSWCEVIGIIKVIEDNKVEIMINCRPELITVSTIRLEDPWEIYSIEFETPINHMWHSGVESQRMVG